MTGEKTPRTIEEWFDYGRECFHKPDGMEAVKAFEIVVDDDPGYRHPDGDNPYFYLGKINEVEGRLDEAIVFYSRALAVDAEDEESRIGRGSCYTVAGKNEKAVDDFLHLLRMPKNKRKVPEKHLLYVIAENYRKMEDWGKAVHWAEKAALADPGNHRHQQQLEKIKAAMRSKK